MTSRGLDQVGGAFAHVDQSCLAFYGGFELTGGFDISYLVITLYWSLMPPQARINTQSSYFMMKVTISTSGSKAKHIQEGMFSTLLAYMRQRSSISPGDTGTGNFRACTLRSTVPQPIGFGCTQHGSGLLKPYVLVKMRVKAVDNGLEQHKINAWRLAHRIILLGILILICLTTRTPLCLRPRRTLAATQKWE